MSQMLETPDTTTRLATKNLQLNAIVLVAANVLTGVLGIVFWGVAARLNSAESVGRASAVIAAATMLATLANLSFGPMFERFLTGFGMRAKWFLLAGFGSAATGAVVLGTLLVLVGPREQLFASTLDERLFPVVVCILAWFALQDHAASALGVARWGGYKNAAHSVVKLAAVAALSGATSAVLVGTWAVPALLCVAALGVLLWRRLRESALTAAPVELPQRRAMLAYFGSSYGIHVVGAIGPLAIPLIVLSVLGSAQTAYFSVAWTLTTAVFVLGTILVGPFVAEVSRHPEALSRLVRRFGVLIAALTVGASLFLGVCAPVVLGVVGTPYRSEGEPLLHYAAVIMPFWLIVVLYEALARVRRRMALAVVTQCVVAAVSIGGTVLLAPGWGIAGVGIAYLVAAVVGAVLVAGPLVRGLRRLAAHPEGEMR